MQTTIRDNLSSPLPIRLRDGEEANYMIPLEETNWLNDFVDNFLLSYPKIRSRFIKIHVYTSVGNTFEAKIEEGLRKKLLETIKNRSNP